MVYVTLNTSLTLKMHYQRFPVYVLSLRDNSGLLRGCAKHHKSHWRVSHLRRFTSVSKGPSDRRNKDTLQSNKSISNKETNLVNADLRALVASLSPAQMDRVYKELQKAESLHARQKAEGLCLVCSD